MTTINLSHLDWTTEQNFDPGNHNSTDLYHECMDWALEHNMNIIFEVEYEEVEFDCDIWDPINGPYTYFATFDNIPDSIMFLLRWSTPE